MSVSLDRRRFLEFSLGGAALLAGDHLLTAPTAHGATLTRTMKSYTQPLQLMPIIDLRRPGSKATIRATQDKVQLHPDLPAPTNVFRYVSTDATDPNPSGYHGFLGPIVVARRGVPVTLNFVNAITATNYADTPWLPCDRNLTCNQDDVIRLMTHQHGGFVWAQFDGNPAVDMGYVKGQTQTVWYGNEQRAGLNWYHDHGMGNTRLNVWSGLAGGYLIRDDIDTGEADNVNGLPSGVGVGPADYELPLVFQDRSFSNEPGSGDFLYATIQQLGIAGGSWGVAGNGPNYYGATAGPWSPEGFGDEMVVNGLCSPYLGVEPRLYRLRLLNGCNARILDLAPTKSVLTGRVPPMWVIGTEGGLLPAPVPVKSLTMMPGERLDVLVDFAGFGGEWIQLKNTNLPAAYTSPAPVLPDGIQFRIGRTVTSAANNSVPTRLVGGEQASAGAPTIGARTIHLNEANAGALHWFMALTGSGAGGRTILPDSYPDQVTGERFNTFHQEIGELPPQDAVQEWDFDNMTMDSHPMHMHLVMFQVVHRRPSGTPATGVADGTGVAVWERGWKDTVAVHPMQITRIRAKFSLPTLTTKTPSPTGFVPKGTSPHYALRPGEAERTYMYHCHILEHEENDMMRPFRVS
jgi:spore coat protein A